VPKEIEEPVVRVARVSLNLESIKPVTFNSLHFVQFLANGNNYEY